MLEWAVQIADAVDAAHSSGMAHRDIKPALLYAGLNGTQHTLWRMPESSDTQAIPSRDGKHVALTACTHENNAWMIEG